MTGASATGLERVFDPNARERFIEYLAAARHTGDERDVKHVSWLLEMLATSGPGPSDLTWEGEKHARRRGWRAALDVYISAAQACGLLDDNMISRFCSTEERNFRSAYSECMACWLLAGRLRYCVAPIAGGGRAGKQLEFVVTTPQGPLYVEVKAPRVDVPEGMRMIRGDDSSALEACMRDAASQFGKGRRNLLVIAPRIRTPVYQDREQLLSLIGVPVIRVTIGGPGERGRAECEFDPRGRLVRPGKTGPDGTPLPAHTRVSAVMTIEPVWGEDERGAFFAEHRVLVLHNPYAECPISDETFAEFPQLVRISDTDMAWTDRTGEPSNDND